MPKQKGCRGVDPEDIEEDSLTVHPQETLVNHRRQYRKWYPKRRICEVQFYGKVFVVKYVEKK